MIPPSTNGYGVWISWNWARAYKSHLNVGTWRLHLFQGPAMISHVFGDGANRPTSKPSHLLKLSSTEVVNPCNLLAGEAPSSQSTTQHPVSHDHGQPMAPACSMVQGSKWGRSPNTSSYGLWGCGCLWDPLRSQTRLRHQPPESPPCEWPQWLPMTNPMRTWSWILWSQMKHHKSGPSIHQPSFCRLNRHIRRLDFHRWRCHEWLDSKNASKSGGPQRSRRKTRRLTWTGPMADSKAHTTSTNGIIISFFQPGTSAPLSVSLLPTGALLWGTVRRWITTLFVLRWLLHVCCTAIPSVKCKASRSGRIAKCWIKTYVWHKETETPLTRCQNFRDQGEVVGGGLVEGAAALQEAAAAVHCQAAPGPLAMLPANLRMMLLWAAVSSSALEALAPPAQHEPARRSRTKGKARSQRSSHDELDCSWCRVAASQGCASCAAWPVLLTSQFTQFKALQIHSSTCFRVASAGVLLLATQVGATTCTLSSSAGNFAFPNKSIQWIVKGSLMKKLPSYGQ